MPSDCITYQNSGYFSKLIVDYLDQKAELKTLYNRFPTVENFGLQIEEKSNNFPIENREILVKALANQYKKIEISKATSTNLELLKDSGLKLKDLKTEQSTLEKIFVSLVKENNEI